jgi:hypothetical protein
MNMRVIMIHEPANCNISNTNTNTLVFYFQKWKHSKIFAATILYSGEKLYDKTPAVIFEKLWLYDMPM